MVISSSLSSSLHKNTESILILIHLLEVWQSTPGYHTYTTQKYLTTLKTRSLAFICVLSIDFVELCFVSKANSEAPSRPSTRGLHLRMPASLPSPKDPSLIRLELTQITPVSLPEGPHLQSHSETLPCKTSAHTLQGTQFSLLRTHPWEVREAIILGICPQAASPLVCAWHTDVPWYCCQLGGLSRQYSFRKPRNSYRRVSIFYRL